MKTQIAALTLFAILAGSAQGQNGVSLLAKVKKPGINYNDIWGYTAPNGDEYALVGTTNGTLFYNCTDPTNPVEVANIAGPHSTWRDMKTYGTYAYVVTEGGAGVQIIDMSNPDNPSLIKTWGTNWWSNAHNVAIDTGAGRMYVCGTNNGTRVLNVGSNAESPPLLGTYNNDYVHDLHVQNGQGHFAEIYDGRYRLVNAVNTSFNTKDSVFTPGLFTHSTWANANDTLCVTTDESGGGHIALYNISNPNNIWKTDEWSVNPATIVHNAYIVGNWAYMSWYTEGFVVADISDPANIEFVGQYDTSPFGPGSGYHGAWGCYPFAPSGSIYISDIEEGFHVLRVDGQAFDMDHVAIDNTEDEAGPYDATATAAPLVSGESTAGVVMWYRVDQGSWQSVQMSPTGNPDEWDGSIPGQNSPSIVEYYIVAVDTSGRQSWLPGGAAPGDDTYQFTVGKIVQQYFNNFDGSGNQGWTHGQDAGTDDWERGAPAGKNGSVSRHTGINWFDPSSAYSGSNVWGNDLGNGTNGSYQPNSENWLESPAIDCSNATNTVLMLQRWLTVEGAPYDAARILVNDQVIWENPLGAGDTFHIMDVNWRQQAYDISDIADGDPNVVIRFELESDDIFNVGGWNLDDVRVVSLQDNGSQDVLILTGDTNGTVGNTVSYQLSNAPLNSFYAIYYSFSLTGVVIDGHQFDIGAPYFTATTGTTDFNGMASWTSGPIPPGGAGRTAYVEARSDDLGEIYDSNVVTLVIQ